MIHNEPYLVTMTHKIGQNEPQIFRDIFIYIFYIYMY